MRVKFREILSENSLNEIEPDMSAGTQSKIRKFQKLEKELPADTGTDEYITKAQEIAELDAEIIKALSEDFEIVSEVQAEKEEKEKKITKKEPEKKSKGKRGNPNFAKGKPNYIYDNMKKKKTVEELETVAPPAPEPEKAPDTKPEKIDVSKAATAVPEKKEEKKEEEKSFLQRRFAR